MFFVFAAMVKPCRCEPSHKLRHNYKEAVCRQPPFAERFYFIFVEHFGQTWPFATFTKPSDCARQSEQQGEASLTTIDFIATSFIATSNLVPSPHPNTSRISLGTTTRPSSSIDRVTAFCVSMLSLPFAFDSSASTGPIARDSASLRAAHHRVKS